MVLKKSQGALQLLDLILHIYIILERIYSNIESNIYIYINDPLNEQFPLQTKNRQNIKLLSRSSSLYSLISECYIQNIGLQ